MAQAETTPPEVGTAPQGPERLTARDWLAALKRSGKEFLDDDCMGLAKQIAFSSMLAFFPAMIFLVGLIGLLGIYDQLMEILGVVAPGAVLVAIVLVIATGLVTAGLFLLIVFGGPLGTAIADEVGLGGAFELLWAILRWPIAFVAIILFFAIVYYLAPNEDQRNWKWISPGSLVGAVLWLNYSAFALLFGAELNSELDRQADIRAAGGENAGLVQHARRTR